MKKTSALPKPTKRLQDKYLEVSRRLVARFGNPTWRRHHPPVDELVDCILSQSTSDANRDKGFAMLKAAFPTWQAVRDAAPELVIAAIRPAGLANQKGPRIQEALRFITRERGEISLDFLSEMEPQSAKAWLTQINGVGPKTAAIVLCFALGMPAFPVDTHVHRVTVRLGLIGPRVSADQAHDILEKIVPREDYYAGHLNIIAHGRTICQARRPRCEVCPLTDLCDYYRLLQVETNDRPTKATRTRKVINQ